MTVVDGGRPLSAAAVTEEVAQVAGVVDVDEDLASGRLTVVGDPSDDAVRDAGYAVRAERDVTS